MYCAIQEKEVALASVLFSIDGADHSVVHVFLIFGQFRAGFDIIGFRLRLGSILNILESTEDE